MQIATTNECLSLLKDNDNFLILTHRGPDGDAVGSAAALCRVLRTIGKTAYLLYNPDLTEGLSRFFEGLTAPDGYEPGYVVAVDLAGVKLLPPNALVYAERCDLCIDHHGTNSFFATTTLVEPHAAACAELVYDLMIAADVKLTPEIAECIYLGVLTDTGCFRYPSVSANTLRIGAECLETGIDFYALNREFIEARSRTRIAVEGAVIRDAKFSVDGRMAYALLSNRSLESHGATDDDVNEISNLLRSIDGVELSVFLREKIPGEWRISARSSPTIDSSAILAHIGGGGHRCAAGATAVMAESEVLDALLGAVAVETDIKL